MFKSAKITLFLIVLLGVVMRLVLLDKYPVGVTGDEIQQGYTGYSILQTGRDEWGEFLPLFPRGFGDYKPPVYSYLTIPAIAVFGLDVFAVRFPAAVMGTLLIIVTYFLVKEWFKERNLALWSAFLLSISPWHVQLSRTAFEGGVGVLLFTLGFWLYLKGRSNFKYLVLAAVVFGLSLYTYHSFRVFTPLFLGFTLFFDRRQFDLKKMMGVGVIFFLFVVPILLNLNVSSARFSDVTMLGDINPQELLLRKFESPAPETLGKIFDGRYVYLGEKFITNYLSYFSPMFFFTSSRPDSSYLNFPFTSLMYLFELIFVSAFFLLAAKRYEKKYLYVLIWLLLAPVAAALTTEGNANRAITFLPLISIVSAIGLVRGIRFAEERLKIRRRFPGYTFAALLLISLSGFVYQYSVHLPFRSIPSLRDGYKEIFREATAKEDSYKKIVFTHAFTEPQIFVAFYGKMDPRIFQQASQNWLRYEKEGKRYVDQLGSYSLGKYEFRDLFWNDERLHEGALFAGGPLEFPGNIEPAYEFKDRYGKVIFKLVEAESNKDKKI